MFDRGFPESLRLTALKTDERRDLWRKVEKMAAPSVHKHGPRRRGGETRLKAGLFSQNEGARYQMGFIGA